MRKLLKTDMNVPLKSHQFLALPMSIIMIHDGYENWFYNEFTQLLANHNNERELTIVYYNYAYLEEYEPLDCLRLTDKMLQVGEHIVDIFKIMIEHDYYVYEFCDDFYISALHLKHHRYHDLLIYGYSDSDDAFYAKAYVGTQIHDIIIPYNEMIQAHNSEFIPSDATKSIFFYKRRETNIPLNPEKLKWHLLDYLEGVDTLSREVPRAAHNRDSYWGICVYDAIEDAILKKPKSLTRNNVYCFYEHKCNMRNKLIYFSENSELSVDEDIVRDLNQVCVMADAFFKLSIKLNYKLSAGMPVQREQDELISQLCKLKKAEIEVLSDYYRKNQAIFESM